jgi:diacylglycerol kinase (ATP)
VLLCALYLGLSRIELICLLFAILSVLFAEMLNTALEQVLDVVAKEPKREVRIAKDIAAGATLLCAVFAIVVGYLILAPHLFEKTRLPTIFEKIKTAPIHTVFVALFIVVVVAILSKILFGLLGAKRGSYARGGMPSGHSAVAFSIWTVVLLLAKEPIVVALVFLLALLVGRSRIVAGYHSAWEVIVGAALGITCTLLLFKILG